MCWRKTNLRATSTKPCVAARSQEEEWLSSRLDKWEMLRFVRRQYLSHISEIYAQLDMISWYRSYVQMLYTPGRYLLHLHFCPIHQDVFEQIGDRTSLDRSKKIWVLQVGFWTVAQLAFEGASACQVHKFMWKNTFGEVFFLGYQNHSESIETQNDLLKFCLSFVSSPGRWACRMWRTWRRSVWCPWRRSVSSAVAGSRCHCGRQLQLKWVKICQNMSKFLAPKMRDML